MKAPGILPSISWLLKHGKRNLVAAMQRDPEAFAHIKQNRRQQTLSGNVALAKSLAEAHNGVLPHPRWLQTNGYHGLFHALRKYPKAFIGIKKDKKRRRLSENIALAKSLAKKHGGLLPNPKWL